MARGVSDVMSIDRSLTANSPLPRSVRRALDAMTAASGRRWRVSELAEIAGVSSRTLQRQFTSFLGKSPLAVQQELALDQVRQALLKAGPRAKVCDLAQRCGFTHFGRFSAAYRRRYGEAPSATLKRQARFAEAVSRRPVLLPLRDQPTLMLARFETNGEDGAMAAHLAADLAAALGRAGVAVTQEARFARYRMSGSLRGDGAHRRLLLQLVDQETGRQVWAHRSDDVLLPDLETHEQLATRIIAAMQPNLRRAEIERADSMPEAALGPHELALRAMPGVQSLDAEGNARALDLLERALARDPDAPLAVSLAAWAYAQRTVYHFASQPGREQARGLALARKALSLPADATTLAVLGSALTLLDDLDGAAHVIGKALAIDGGCAWAWSRSAWIEVYRGEPEAAIERFRIGLDLAPQDALAFNSLVGLGCAHFKAGNYADAARWHELAVLEHPSSAWMHRTLCPAYLLTGARPAAERSLDALRAHYPDLTLAQVQRGFPPLPQSYRNLVLEALSDLGLPQ
jgi:AraC-like DNA-binding protein/Tfp pilus assembly protein PilF